MADLFEARRKLQLLTEQARVRGAHWAGQIGHAIDDQLTDGFWDRVHDSVAHLTWAFDDLTKNLGNLTTAVALISLAVPGLDMVVLGLSAATFAYDAWEVEQGEGSLFDVGLDLAGLVSFGAAGRIGKGLEDTMKLTRRAAGEVKGAKAAEDLRRAQAPTREALERVIADPSSGAAERSEAGRHLENLDQAADQAHADVAREIREARLARGGIQRLFSGSKEDAQRIATTKHLLAEHRGNRLVERAAADFARQKAMQHANFLGATAADWFDKSGSNPLNQTAWANSYRDFKDRFKISEGAMAE